MRPVAIPDEVMWPGARRVFIGVSKSQKMQDIHELVAAVDQIRGGPLDGMPRMQVRMELEPGDLDALRHNPHVWLAFLGVDEGIYPFSLSVETSANQPSSSLQLEAAIRRFRDELAARLDDITGPSHDLARCFVSALDGILATTVGLEPVPDGKVIDASNVKREQL